MRRREFLRWAALGALAARARVGGDAPARTTGRGGVLLNDVHSGLNPTRVARVESGRSLEELQRLVRAAASEGRTISIGGGRHAMGGQQFGEATLHLDTRALSRVIAFDQERGRIEVEAGIQWPELIRFLRQPRPGGAPAWGIVQKQTGADDLCVGGALSANAHGRGLALPPIVGDVESFVLVDAEGEARRCSRTEDRELFALAIGGYGLFGVIHSVVLRLKPRRTVRRSVRILGVDDLPDAVADRIARGFTYGDFQFEIDPRSPGFLARGIFSCYEPVGDDAAIPAGQRELSRADWMELIRLAHVDKARAFDSYARHYLATNGQLYADDLQQLGLYPAGYHRELDAATGARAPGSEMITELFVPRAELPGFLRAAAERLRRSGASVVYGTVRWIEPDRETFLAWARAPFACIVLNLHVDHEAEAIAAAAGEFRALIDLARVRGGTYFLTYHRFASREQVLACHPRLPGFLRAKRRHDPEELFQSEWYRHHVRLLPA